MHALSSTSWNCACELSLHHNLDNTVRALTLKATENFSNVRNPAKRASEKSQAWEKVFAKCI
jgi:hypothetical protein